MSGNMHMDVGALIDGLQKQFTQALTEEGFQPMPKRGIVSLPICQCWSDKYRIHNGCIYESCFQKHITKVMSEVGF